MTYAAATSFFVPTNEPKSISQRAAEGKEGKVRTSPTFVTVVQNSTLDLNARKTWMPYPVPGKSTERKHM